MCHWRKLPEDGETHGEPVGCVHERDAWCHESRASPLPIDLSLPCDCFWLRVGKFGWPWTDMYCVIEARACLLDPTTDGRLNPPNCSDGNSRSFFPQFPTPLHAAFSPWQEGLEVACCGSGTWKRRHTKLMVRGAPTPSMLAHRRARRHHLYRGNVDRVRGNGALQLLPALDLHLNRPPCSGAEYHASCRSWGLKPATKPVIPTMRPSMALCEPQKKLHFTWRTQRSYHTSKEN